MKSQSRRSYDRRRCNMADADEIAKLCYDRFESLPRRGKPEPGREWTLLAAVLQITRCTNTDTVKKEVISLGTGTKCIGQTQMSPNGDVLNDSHAEVIARRGCIRYLIQELLKAVKDGKSSVFCPADEKGKWKLQSGVSFVFFTSHTPCGDASIIPMSDGESQPCVAVASEKAGDLKRKAEEPIERQNAKLPRLREQMDPTSEDAKKDQSQSDEAKKSEVPDVPDVHRTGAKCVPGGLTDPLHPGIGYHSTGVLRVKPGRGEPTLSLSCSDKMAQWTVLGFQGALLSHYLQEALYFSIIVVGKCPYNREVMERALITRCSHISNLPAGFSVTPPLLLQSSLEFPFSQAQTELRHQAGRGRISPCGAAISWCNVADQPLDVTANGYKHGVTKKALGTAKARSLLCKVELFHNFLSLVSATEPSQLPDSLRKRDLQTYWDYKEASRSYQHAWQQLHGPRGFSLWPRSDRNFLLFC